MTEEFVSVQLSELFHLRSGDPAHVRGTVDANPGPYPVYSASLSSPFGYIASFDYEGEYLTWVMNGYGGRVQVVEGRFSATRDRGVMVPRPDSEVPDLTYLKFAAEPELSAMAVGRRVDGRLNEYTKIYPSTAGTASVLLPLDENGEIDYPLMRQIGERLRRLEDLKSPLRESREQLASAQLSLAVDHPVETLSLADSDLFELSIGERVLRSEFVEPGVPAYSANVTTPFGHVARSNLEDFQRPSLLWGIDGIFDWNLIPAGDEFATTDHCGRLQLRCDQLDPEYIYYYLKSTRTSYGFDRVFRASLRNMKANVVVEVPVTGDGRFDLDRQRAAADAFRSANWARLETVGSLDLVLEARLGLAAAS